MCWVRRVHTDPGKIWKVMGFKAEFFQALKSLENDRRYGKVWKTLDNHAADLENIDFHYTG